MSRAKIAPYHVMGPVGNGINFHDPQARIPFHFFGVRPGRGLVAANGRDPRPQLRELSLQWFHFPNPATQIRIARPEFWSYSSSLFFRRQGRQHPLDLNSITLLHLLNQPVGFGKEEGSIKNKHAQTWPHTRGNVDQGDSLWAESRRNGHILAIGL